jgi:hypothetical protein
MVEAEEATEPLVADDLSSVLSERVVGRDEQIVAKSLVVALLVIVSDEGRAR